ncbi:MAG: hypothetical protein ACYCS7_04785 [Acidimicrobiales bacterium]
MSKRAKQNASIIRDEQVGVLARLTRRVAIASSLGVAGLAGVMAVSIPGRHVSSGAPASGATQNSVSSPSLSSSSSSTASSGGDLQAPTQAPTQVAQAPMAQTSAS